MNRILNFKNLRSVLFQSYKYTDSLKLVNTKTSPVINIQRANLLKIEFYSLNQIRFLSKRKGSNKDKIENNKKGLEEEEGDDEYEDLEGDDDDTSLIDSIDTSEFQPGFKIIQKHVPSLRVDSLLAAGLNISRKKIDDNFYSSKLRLNGEKVLKKSHPVKENDKIDLIGDLDEKTGKRTLKRVFLYKLLNENSKKNKPKVVLITWKHGLFEEDAYKNTYKH